MRQKAKPLAKMGAIITPQQSPGEIDHNEREPNKKKHPVKEKSAFYRKVPIRDFEYSFGPYCRGNRFSVRGR